MRYVAIVLIAITTSAACGQAQEVLNLPRGAAPVQALAGFNADGKLVIKQSGTQTFYVPITTISPDGKSATTAYEQRTGPRIQTTTIDKVRAHDVRGNPIQAKRLRKLLRDETPVLMSADGRPVDPLHLRLYKDDVVVLMTPTEQQPNAARASAVVPAPPFEPAPAPVEIVKAGQGELSVRILGERENRFGLEHRYVIDVNNNSDNTVAPKAFVYLPKGVTVLPLDLKTDTVMAKVGDIQSGNSRSLDLKLTAVRAGAYEIRVVVTAEPNRSVELKFSALFEETPPPGVLAPPPVIQPK